MDACGIGPLFLVLPPSGADNIFLSQDFIDLGHRQMDTVLQPQEVLNLLATTVKLPFPQLPHQPLYYGIYLPSSTLTSLGLLMLV